MQSGNSFQTGGLGGLMEFEFPFSGSLTSTFLYPQVTDSGNNFTTGGLGGLMTRRFGVGPGTSRCTFRLEHTRFSPEVVQVDILQNLTERERGERERRATTGYDPFAREVDWLLPRGRARRADDAPFRG